MLVQAKNYKIKSPPSWSVFDSVSYVCSEWPARAFLKLWQLEQLVMDQEQLPRVPASRTWNCCSCTLHCPWNTCHNVRNRIFSIGRFRSSLGFHIYTGRQKMPNIVWLHQAILLFLHTRALIPYLDIEPVKEPHLRFVLQNNFLRHD